MMPHRFSGLLLVAVCCCMLNTGCASLALFPGAADDRSSEPAPLKESPEAAMFRAVQTARQTGAIVVQVQGAEKPLKVIPLPTDGSTVFISDLIQQMDLKRRFSSLNVTLFRSTDHVMDGVKMAVTFNKAGHVTTGTDYALRPGDRVTVRHELHSALQSVLDNALPTIAR